MLQSSDEISYLQLEGLLITLKKKMLERRLGIGGFCSGTTQEQIALVFSLQHACRAKHFHPLVKAINGLAAIVDMTEHSAGHF